MEVAPPSAANTIALVRLTEGEPAGGEATRCAFATEDIEADHAELRVRASTPRSRTPGSAGRG
jgi:hypothetical protein